MASERSTDKRLEVDYGREPCPSRIVEELGGAFAMGAVGGFVWNLIKDCRNYPRGDRLRGALYTARSRTAVTASSFAIWGGVFAAFECSLQHYRRKADHINPVISGFATGYLLSSRSGTKAAMKQALVGAGLLSAIEGVGIVFSKNTAQTPRQQFLAAVQQEEKRKKKELRAAELSEKGGGSWLSSRMHQMLLSISNAPAVSVDK